MRVQQQSWREVALQGAREAGFDAAGIAPVPGAGTPELEFFHEWLRRGYAGEMAYLETRTAEGAPRRATLASVAPWARSVIVCALNYNCALPYSLEARDARRGWISRYAWFDKSTPAGAPGLPDFGRPGNKVSADYHDAVRLRLRTVEARLRARAIETGDSIETRCYVDTGPLVERVYAKYAGVGWIGKNTCIMNQRLGSWLFLGVILTSLELHPDLPAPDRCGSCRRCIEACPTEALIAPYQLDARRCIAYLTIEKRGAIPEELRDGMGNHLFGCDICQDVCPWNRGNRRDRLPVSSAPEFSPDPALFNPALEWIAGLSQQEFQQTFRRSPVKRAKYSGLRRNAVIAMGNSGDQFFLPQLRELANDPDSVVAEHARWAIAKLERSATSKEQS